MLPSAETKIIIKKTIQTSFSGINRVVSICLVLLKHNTHMQPCHQAFPAGAEKCPRGTAKSKVNPYNI